MLIFQLTINHTDRRRSHFPAYQKDHLFSSNPSWDFGAFRKLEQLIKHSQFNSSRFAHVFTDTGKYVFQDSAVPDWSLIVVVSEPGAECDPAGAVFQPSSPAQLVRHGVLKQHRLNLLPNWGAIAGVLGLLVLLIVVLTATALVLKQSSSGLNARRQKPRWRSLGEPNIPPGYVYAGDSLDRCDALGLRGVGEGAEAVEPAVCRGGYKSGRVELEEFNVRTLYDKLEDQTLHLACQLAKHRKDTQEFYRNMCQKADAVRDLLENMDDTKLEQLKELLGLDRSQSMVTAEKEGQAEKEDAKADRPVALMEAVLQAVERLLYRVDRESWGLQEEETAPCPGEAGDCGAHTGCIQGLHGSLQVSSADMTEPRAVQETGPLPADTVNLQSAEACLSEENLSKLVVLTPLSRTLKEIQQSLQNLSPAGAADVGESLEEPAGHLAPVALGNLSPHHFAIFLFGCHIVHLLRDAHGFPPATLLLAHTVPVSRCCGLVEHCHRDFYYDSNNCMLYLRTAKLENAGEFVAVLLHSMAFISAGSAPKDFIQALHRAISVLSLALFDASFRSGPNQVSGVFSPDSARQLDSRPEGGWLFQAGRVAGSPAGALAEDFLQVKLPSAARFSEDQLAQRLQKFKFFKLPQLLKDFKPHSALGTGKGPAPTDEEAAVQELWLEQEIDRLNEAFLQLSLGLQERAGRTTWPEENHHGFHSAAQGAAESPLSRHGTLLLELRRRCVVQRLSEMHDRLSQISKHQPDSQETDCQKPAGQEADNKGPSGQGPDSQEPTSQGQASQESDSQKPESFVLEGRG
ncbi:uncharacterized protein LOC118783846 [Megalops cyprinoides]|uniref:uncharacterized protein LOC118783846 n=1 Tax=Megalops cyprinoides TaxID=118141 RepID=UPI001863F71F|nr:uncharacterized protein LOC118783846 [Megalops cyprinoides]